MGGRFLIVCFKEVFHCQVDIYYSKWSHMAAGVEVICQNCHSTIDHTHVTIESNGCMLFALKTSGGKQIGPSFYITLVTTYLTLQKKQKNIVEAFNIISSYSQCICFGQAIIVWNQRSLRGLFSVFPVSVPQVNVGPNEEEGGVLVFSDLTVPRA